MRGIALAGQTIHAPWRRVGCARFFDALTPHIKRPAVARANEQLFLVLEIEGAAQMRADGREGVDLASLAAHEPDPADYLVGMQGPGIAAKRTDHHLLWLAEG